MKFVSIVSSLSGLKCERVEADDAENFLRAFCSAAAEVIYGLRVSVETRRDSRGVVVCVRPAGAITWARRRSWSKLRDELLGVCFHVAGVFVRPIDLAKAWEKFPVLTLIAKEHSG